MQRPRLASPARYPPSSSGNPVGYTPRDRRSCHCRIGRRPFEIMCSKASFALQRTRTWPHQFVAMAEVRFRLLSQSSTTSSSRLVLLVVCRDVSTTLRLLAVLRNAQWWCGVPSTPDAKRRRHRCLCLVRLARWKSQEEAPTGSRCASPRPRPFAMLIVAHRTAASFATECGVFDRRT